MLPTLISMVLEELLVGAEFRIAQKNHLSSRSIFLSRNTSTQVRTTTTTTTRNSNS